MSAEELQPEGIKKGDTVICTHHVPGRTCSLPVGAIATVDAYLEGGTALVITKTRNKQNVETTHWHGVRACQLRFVSRPGDPQGWITVHKMRPKEAKPPEPLTTAEGKLRLTRKREAITPPPTKAPGVNFAHPLMTGREPIQEGTDIDRAFARVRESLQREVRDHTGNVVGHAEYQVPVQPQVTPGMRPVLIPVAEDFVRATGVMMTTAIRMIHEIDVNPQRLPATAVELARLTTMGADAALELVEAFARRIHPNMGTLVRDEPVTFEQLLAMSQAFQATGRVPESMPNAMQEFMQQMNETSVEESAEERLTRLAFEEENLVGDWDSRDSEAPPQISLPAPSDPSSMFSLPRGSNGTTRRWCPVAPGAVHPGYPEEGWKEQVAWGNTRLGYVEWVNLRLSREIDPTDDGQRVAGFTEEEENPF